jgi:hypothetical protein
MPAPLRAELNQLAASGHQIDAINRYRAVTGADLGTAATVIDAIGRK